MQKLDLGLESLTVESFTTAEERSDPRGTVKGYSDTTPLPGADTYQYTQCSTYCTAPQTEHIPHCNDGGNTTDPNWTKEQQFTA